MNIVFPWSDSNFSGSMAQKDLIYKNLKRVHLSVEQWKKTPSSKVETVIGQVLPGIFEKKWQVVCSNSVDVLQAIAEVCPIIFSLTTHDSSVMVTTEGIVKRLRMRDVDDIAPVDDLLWQVRNSGFLTWFNVTQTHDSRDYFHSKFSDLLIKRKSFGYATVFLSTYLLTTGVPFGVDSVPALVNKLTAALGETAALLIREMSSFRYFETDVGIPDAIGVRV